MPNSLTAGSLRVEFTKTADRWSHIVSVTDGDQSRIVLESLEGNAGDAWPPSPPFQELSQETLPDGRMVIFLVGKAGGSHWSASVEAISEPPQLVFDIACRHTQAPLRLASTYRDKQSAIDARPLLPSTQCQFTTDRTLIVDCSDPPSKFPATTRWKFCLELVDPKRD